MKKIKISICIPAFNRPDKLDSLLTSIFNQNYKDVEIIICEDMSPARCKIRQVVSSYNDSRIRYIENNENLGYDANLRTTIQLATGEYVMLMGNDDLLSKGSLDLISKKINKYKPSVIIRSYESFYKEEKNFYQIHRYVNNDKYIQLNKDELAWLFYRVVLVSGLVINRRLAEPHHSAEVDGTLYYQNYLICKVAHKNKVLYIPDIIVKNRLEDAGDFGSSKIESGGAWVPGERTIDSSLYQMKKFFYCAEITSKAIKTDFTLRLKKISSAYSYSLIAYHCDKELKFFFFYIIQLKKLGYSGVYFYSYSLALKMLGKKKCDLIISRLKKIIGFTIRLV